MKFCELGITPVHLNEQSDIWCETHDLPANHLATDGDTPICKLWADEYGCNSCPPGTHVKEIPELRIGSEINVHGRTFVLVCLTFPLDKPAEITFKEKR